MHSYLPPQLGLGERMAHPPTFSLLLWVASLGQGSQIELHSSEQWFSNYSAELSKFLRTVQGLLNEWSIYYQTKKIQTAQVCITSNNFLILEFYIRFLMKNVWLTALDLFHIPLAFLPSLLHFSLIAKREKGLLSLKEPWASTACTYWLAFKMSFLSWLRSWGIVALLLADPVLPSSIRLDIWSSDFLNLDWLVVSILHPCSYLGNHLSTM